MKKTPIKQPEPPAKEVSTEILANSIVAIADGFRKLRAGRLNDKALFLLIQHAAPNVGGRRGFSPISIKEIKAVLAGIDNLESEYVKKPTKA